MNYTENYKLGLPELTDKFLVDTVNGNFDKLDGLFGGLKMRALSEEEFAIITPDGHTVYFVTGTDGSVSIYVGSVKTEGGGEGDLTLFELVDSIAKSMPAAQNTAAVPQVYIYAGQKELADGEEAFALISPASTSAADIAPAVRVTGFSADYSLVSCGVRFAWTGTSYCYVGEGEWYVTSRSDAYSRTYTEELQRYFYNLKEFASHHPVYDSYNTGILTVGGQAEISTVFSAPIGAIFDTGITNENNIVIVNFSSGLWIYRYPAGALPAAYMDGNLYRFSSVSGAARTNIRSLTGQDYSKKQTLSYSSAGAFSVDPRTEKIVCATFDAVDSSGNIIFAKNADVADYV